MFDENLYGESLSEDALVATHEKILEEAKARAFGGADPEDIAQDGITFLLEHPKQPFHILRFIHARSMAASRSSAAPIPKTNEVQDDARTPQAPTDPSEIAELNECLELLTNRLLRSPRKWDHVTGCYLLYGLDAAHTMVCALQEKLVDEGDQRATHTEPRLFRTRNGVFETLLHHLSRLEPHERLFVVSCDREFRRWAQQKIGDQGG